MIRTSAGQIWAKRITVVPVKNGAIDIMIYREPDNAPIKIDESIALLEYALGVLKNAEKEARGKPFLTGYRSDFFTVCGMKYLDLYGETGGEEPE